MSEQKVWVDKMPESCFECQIITDGSEGCDFCVCAILEEKATTKNRLKDCPLHSIKDHDRELVRQVCEKIREHLSEQKKSLKDTFSPYSNGKAFIISAVEENLNKIEKEYEK